MKRARFVAVIVVLVMVMGAVSPACAFSGKDVVKETGKEVLKQAETIEAVYEISKTGSKLYNAKNNDERVDILIETAKNAGKGIAKAPVKAAADTAIMGGATSTAVYVAGAAGMTAKTGTAIAALSGAAATNATLAAIGTPVVSALGIAAAPAVVGGVIVGAAAAGVCYGVHCLIDWIW